MQINNYPEQQAPRRIKPRKQNTCLSRFALTLSIRAPKKYTTNQTQKVKKKNKKTH